MHRNSFGVISLREFPVKPCESLSRPIRIRTFHRRDAEHAEEIPFAQLGDDDWAKTYSSNLKNVFVCRRLPTNKKLSLCALCGLFCISSFVYFASFVVKQFVTTKSTKVTKFGSLFVPRTQGSQRLSYTLCASAVRFLKKIPVCLHLRVSAVNCS